KSRTAARAFQRRTPIGSSCPSYVCRVQANRPAESALASRSRNGSSKPTTARSGSTARCVRGREWCSLFRSAAMSVNGPHGEPTGARLLVVDDEPAMIRTLRTNLRGHNFQVETAENAAEAKASYDRRRSEEHTSELQSRVDLVCRLLRDK